MNMDERIKRINALYHKSRKEYVASVRANLRGQLDNITIINQDGTKENLGEKFGGKQE